MYFLQPWMYLREMFLDWVIANMPMLQSCSLSCILNLRFSKPLKNLWASSQDFVAVSQYSDEVEISICVKEPGNTLENARLQFQPVHGNQKHGPGKKIASPCSAKQGLSGLTSTWKICRSYLSITLTGDCMLIRIKLQNNRYSPPKMLVKTENLCLQSSGSCCYLFISIV